MEQQANERTGFFGALVEKRTYLNILYLLLSFPLGIFYFIFLTVGLSLGVGLTPIFIGIFVLFAVFVCSRIFMYIERRLAVAILGMKIQEYPRQTQQPDKGLFKRIADEVLNVDSWKGIIYLYCKFALGIFSFVLCVTLVSVSIALICAPIFYQFMISYAGMDFNYNSWLPYIGINATPFEESILYFVIGTFLGIGSLHVFNFTARASGKFLEIMSPKA